MYIYIYTYIHTYIYNSNIIVSTSIETMSTRRKVSKKSALRTSFDVSTVFNEIL